MENGTRKLKIGRPYIEEKDDHTRLCVLAELDGAEHVLWFAVGKQYGEYLTQDRTDAFVTALLPAALRSGADIVCEGPVTRRLLYQFNHYLIPMLAGNLPGFHAMKVAAEPSDVPPACAGAVGTGWTGGVDSMYTLMKHISAEESHYRLTHLLVAGNGAVVGKDASATLKYMVKTAREGIAAELGGEVAVVGADSNLQELLPEDFRAVQGFRLASIVLAMQKLFGVFLHSGSYAFAEFGFDPYCFSRYELAVLGFFNTDHTSFYSAGGDCSRRHKLEQLADFPLARKYLHPCVMAKRNNCGRCQKCVWAECTLYVLDKLEDFSAVFNVSDFKRRKDWFIKTVSNMGDFPLAHMLARKEAARSGRFPGDPGGMGWIR